MNERMNEREKERERETRMVKLSIYLAEYEEVEYERLVRV